MLAERQIRLLTAYVDGELSPTQRRQAGRLLRRSEEARELLRRLQEDSRQLRALPRLAVPTDLSGPILASIGPSRPRPVSRPHPVRATFPAWTGWAAAAAVLLAVAVGSFFSYSGTGPEGQGDSPLATAPGDNGKDERVVPDGRLAKKVDQPPDDPWPDDVTIPEGPPDPPEPPEKKIDPPVRPIKPVSDRLEGPVLTSPSKEPGVKIERVELALPTIHQLADLDRPEAVRRLREQFAAAPAFRVELPARDATRAFTRIRAAATRVGLALVIDPTAQARLRKPQFRHDYAVFVENITPADLVVLLRTVARADRLAAAKKPAEQRLGGALVVRELSEWDQKELSNLLGVDPVRVRPTAAKKQAGLDIRRPLDEQTGANLAALLDGIQGARPGVKQPERAGLVVPLTGPRSRSLEVRRFLDQRTPAQPGTVQVFLVLRNLPH
jgi:hypothetical protein